MHDEENNPLEKALHDLREGQEDLERAEALEIRAKEEIRRAETEIEESRHREYEFFVDGTRFVTPHEELTGAQIKGMVPNWPSADGLELEGEGDHPNRLIADHEKVRFHKEHATYFIKVPPATFGAQE